MARAPESPGHLLLTCSPLEAPEGATHSPRPSPTLPVPLSLSLALILSPSSVLLTRTEPPPPTRTTVATGHPTPHRRPRKLCLDLLILPTTPSNTRSPAVTPLPPSSPTGIEDRQPIRRLRRLPELADPLFDLTVSP